MGAFSGDGHFSGSSPLARGLRNRGQFSSSAPRIIPARAGFTNRVGCTSAPTGDHPRSRGVYRTAKVKTPWSGGSSPLARGLLADMLLLPHVSRIIPARAGFTFSGTMSLGESTDHPRSRGVYISTTIPRDLYDGSSPLARGLLGRGSARIIAGRIIPARAGFTLADPWNPNEPVLYQTPVAFTADLGPAPPSCGSAAVVLRWTTTPSGA